MQSAWHKVWAMRGRWGCCQAWACAARALPTHTLLSSAVAKCFWPRLLPPVLPWRLPPQTPSAYPTPTPPHAHTPAPPTRPQPTHLHMHPFILVPLEVPDVHAGIMAAGHQPAAGRRGVRGEAGALRRWVSGWRAAALSTQRTLSRLSMATTTEHPQARPLSAAWPDSIARPELSQSIGHAGAFSHASQPASQPAQTEPLWGNNQQVGLWGKYQTRQLA